MRVLRDSNPFRTISRTLPVLLLFATALVLGTPASQACCGSAGSVAPYDFNGDGYADLAVGAIEVPFNSTDTGNVTVLYGSATGITTTGSQLWSQDSPGIADSGETGDSFGQSMASGDFNGDDYADLAIAVPGENLTGYDEGLIHILFGSASGLTSAGSQIWSQDSPGILDIAQNSDQFGEVMAAGNVGNGAFDDLIIGLPSEDFSPRDGAAQSGSGAVQVLFGSPSGLTSVGNQFWSQESPGIPGNAAVGDHFGQAVLAADVTGDAYEDVVIGVPFEDLSGGAQAGAVHVLPGGATGPTVVASSTWTQATAGVADDPEPNDLFGYSLAAGDFGGSSHQELAISAIGEGVVASQTGNGAVHVLAGSAAGLTATGSQFWTQNSSGVLETAESGDNFGIQLSSANLGKSAQDDLAIGVDEVMVGTYRDGLVQVLYGSTTGLTSTGNQIWHPDIAGVPDDLDAEETFGSQLQLGDFGGSTIADLVAGSPTENVDGVYAVGAVTVIYGSSNGLTASGSQYLTPATPGVPGDPEGNARFGYLGH